ncbi:hypothetical protein HZH66_004274 [Vespula vulgaris]|uniref:Uncharacterized protein n=1 Tax=Vespula vulgaris TaxID=7454 RepID=A0A834KES1_VESVU|nr:hypothetical protein HZH66_004274 [Vespula vulgaris]
MRDVKEAEVGGGMERGSTDSDQLEVIPRVESPASRSMKFFLSPLAARTCEKSGLLHPHPTIEVLARGATEEEEKEEEVVAAEEEEEEEEEEEKV